MTKIVNNAKFHLLIALNASNIKSYIKINVLIVTKFQDLNKIQRNKKELVSKYVETDLEPKIQSMNVTMGILKIMMDVVQNVN